MDQKFEDVVIECNNCHLEFYATTLRTDPASNMLMCVNCLSLPGSKINVLRDRPLKKKIVLKEAPIPKVGSLPKKEQASKIELPTGYSHYRCGSCRYEFSRKNGFSNPCPYCSKKSVSTVRAN